VIIYNGNSIGVRGDLSSRKLQIEIESPSINPAEREFAHEDPVQWTIDKRVTILTHLFNILMVKRDAPAKAKTRFKAWWRAVGHPLELVAASVAEAPDATEPEERKALLALSFNIAAEIRDNDDDDEETLARTRIIARLWREFGKEPSLFGNTQQSKTFGAKDVVKLLPSVDDTAPPEDAVELAADLRTVANRKVNYSAKGVARILKQHVTGWVALADRGVARLVGEVDPHTKNLEFYVEKR
jgi:hypothetical protein